MRNIILFFSLFAAFFTINAQTEISMGSVPSATGCELIVYDNGGFDNNYSHNSTDVLTIYSNDPNNNSATVEITFLDIDPSDTLYVYDGPSVNSPLLLKMNNSNYFQFGIYIYSASVQNTSGALTLKFVSDGQDDGEGFIIQTYCTAPCQGVEITLDTLLSSHHPHIDPDDGFFYIDVCPYDTVHLVTHGYYPDNNYSYTQSDQLSRFTWDLGIDVIDSVGGNILDYYFTPGRGYDVNISITDTAGCFSQIPIIFRVRTSLNPIKGISDFAPMCAGQIFSLDVGYDDISSIQLDSVGSEQITSLGVSDTIFLPDGVSCPPYGTYYRSYVNFTSFNPQATITDANDILYVRIKMEHSAIEDIRISLYCPNGSMCKIVPDYQNDGWGGLPHNYFRLNLGRAWRPDVAGCNAALNNMGEPWNYIWSNNTQQGYQYAGGIYGYAYEGANVLTVYNPHWDAGTSSYSIDSSDVATMSQIYHPLQSFNGMVGCPLNGGWYIQVEDLWDNDNGYIVEWEMALDPSLLPQNWSYTVNIDTILVTGPGANGSTIIPNESGTLNYVATIIDEFGCEYDTNFSINVVQSPQPDLGEDIGICAGDLFLLESNYQEPNTTYHWNTGDITEDIYVLSAGDYIINVATSNSDTTLTCYGSDTINIYINPMPTAQFEANITESCAPLTLKLTNQTTPDSVDMYYEWYLYNENWELSYSSFLKNPSFEIEEPGIYQVLLFVSTEEGCVDSLTKWNYISVYPQPIAEFSADPEVSMLSENEGAVQFTNYSDTLLLADPETSWHWDFGDGVLDSAEFSPIHNYLNWGDYEVTLFISTGAGCSSEITHIVTIEEELVFPNIITPNNDGKNDFFAIKNLNTNINPEDPDEFRTNTLHIFDRWGKKVYEADNYDTYIDDNDLVIKGNVYFDASQLSDGVYYFTFYYKGKAKIVNYHGTLNVIR